jgi:hypothetical protein
MMGALMRSLAPFLIVIIIIIILFSGSFGLTIISNSFAARYYQDQTDFSETTVPTSGFIWEEAIHVCIFKQAKIPNSYYVWAKLAVQEWRQALREYTHNQKAWNITARYSPSESQMEGCNVRVYIFETYKEFPGYPEQTGAYTAIQYRDGVAESANVYLAPVVLHGDGKTEIKLPDYAFRNSATHEMGHVLGLAHMAKYKGYLMSPVFDFFDNHDQLPITTLELSTLVKLYGPNGFPN